MSEKIVNSPEEEFKDFPIDLKNIINYGKWKNKIRKLLLNEEKIITKFILVDKEYMNNWRELSGYNKYEKSINEIFNNPGNKNIKLNLKEIWNKNLISQNKSIASLEKFPEMKIEKLLIINTKNISIKTNFEFIPGELYPIFKNKINNKIEKEGIFNKRKLFIQLSNNYALLIYLKNNELEELIIEFPKDEKISKTIFDEIINNDIKLFQKDFQFKNNSKKEVFLTDKNGLKCIYNIIPRNIKKKEKVNLSPKDKKKINDKIIFKEKEGEISNNNGNNKLNNNKLKSPLKVKLSNSPLNIINKENIPYLQTEKVEKFQNNRKNNIKQINNTDKNQNINNKNILSNKDNKFSPTEMNKINIPKSLNKKDKSESDNRIPSLFPTDEEKLSNALIYEEKNFELKANPFQRRIINRRRMSKENESLNNSENKKKSNLKNHELDQNILKEKQKTNKESFNLKNIPNSLIKKMVKNKILKKEDITFDDVKIINESDINYNQIIDYKNNNNNNLEIKNKLNKQNDIPIIKRDNTNYKQTFNFIPKIDILEQLKDFIIKESKQKSKEIKNIPKTKNRRHEIVDEFRYIPNINNNILYNDIPMNKININNENPMKEENHFKNMIINNYYNEIPQRKINQRYHNNDIQISNEVNYNLNPIKTKTNHNNAQNQISQLNPINFIGEKDHYNNINNGNKISRESQINLNNIKVNKILPKINYNKENEISNKKSINFNSKKSDSFPLQNQIVYNSSISLQNNISPKKANNYNIDNQIIRESNINYKNDKPIKELNANNAQFNYNKENNNQIQILTNPNLNGNKDNTIKNGEEIQNSSLYSEDNDEEKIYDSQDQSNISSLYNINDINKIDPSILKQYMLFKELENNYLIEELEKENKKLKKDISHFIREKEKFKKEKKIILKSRDKIIEYNRKNEEKLLQLENELKNKYNEKRKQLQEIKNNQQNPELNSSKYSELTSSRNITNLNQNNIIDENIVHEDIKKIDIKDSFGYPENRVDDIKDDDEYPENGDKDIKDNDEYPENNLDDIKDNDEYPENSLADIQNNKPNPENNGENVFDNNINTLQNEFRDNEQFYNGEPSQNNENDIIGNGFPENIFPNDNDEENNYDKNEGNSELKNENIYNDNEVNEELIIEEYNPCLGLAKIENPNYLNSLIQCFAHIPEITDQIINIHNEPALINELPKLELTRNYREVLMNIFFPEKLSNLNRSPYKPIKFINSLYNLNIENEYINYREFIEYLIKELHEELNLKKNIQGINNINNNLSIKNENDILVEFLQNFTKENNSCISKCLYGITKLTLYCHQCQNALYNFEPYSYLYFNLSKVLDYKFNKYNNDSNELNIFDCLEYYQRTETLIGDKGIFCPYCQRQTESTCIKNLYSSKTVLIFVFERNKNNEIYEDIDFDLEETINLRDYIQYQKEGEKIKEKFYLSGIVTYFEDNYGNQSFKGFCRMGKNNVWFCYDNEDVYPVEFKDIKNNGHPIILFYHKIFKK